ncbi:phage portal protein [Frankia sp. AgPm24]|uniref:phage portal protein n=1 Tax=Frankia sp. AgPm24 TaxID=631128 RepID=UPI00200DDFEF|nr:phage portal protein [Frankia sp. AgPm24]MCK9921611.1 phage portal protein [Frankia sp. AgPm24]
MVMSAAETVDRARYLLELRDQERPRLARIRCYLRDEPDQILSGLPADTPLELHRLARLGRVNMLRFVVGSRVQSMYVDGLRLPRQADNVEAWRVWQANRMDARQIGVHRAAIAYGASYVTVLPGTRAGEPMPVLRGVSPRRLTAAYGADDEWPAYALEQRRSGWRLYDAEAVYDLTGADADTLAFAGVPAEHGAGVCPVVRIRDSDDLDDEVCGAVEPLMFLQDQINITTFGLLVAQHYGAFRQRYVIGWLAESETQRLKASASRLMTFDDPEVKVGEFGETTLAGYLASREATIRHLATVSQTPAHELLGQLVNLSAEALAAAEASHRRALSETQTVAGEGWEQALQLGGSMIGVDVPDDAEVRWRDTESRSLAQVADALGKIAQMLGVPPAELWEMLPGVSQQQVERWRAAAAEGDAFAQMNRLLDEQASALTTPTPAPAVPADASL